MLDILEETPIVEDITDGVTQMEGDIRCEHVSFAYKDEKSQAVLENFSKTFEQNKIHGILGKSGCGKSTLLKLLMRFYETEQGSISYGKDNVNEINTAT